jgi:hypothetical protein
MPQDDPNQAPVEAPEPQAQEPAEGSIAATVNAVLDGESAPAAPQTPLDAVNAALEETSTETPEAPPVEPAQPEAEAALELAPEQQEWRAAHQELQQFNEALTQRGLTGDDLRLGVDVMTAIKSGDPAKALAMLKPLVESLETAAGEVLPPFLQQAVDEGQIVPELAQQLAKQLAGGQTAEQRLQAQEQQRAQAETQRFQSQMLGTADSWEKQKAASDPEFSARLDLVKEVVQARVGSNPPTTAADLLKMLNDADAFVRGKFPKVPRPATPAAPSPTRTGVTSPRPKSALEAVNLALQAN